MSHVVTSHAQELTTARERIAETGRSIYDRGLTFGSTGNISVRLSDGRLLLTPTNVAMGRLDPAALSLTDAGGAYISGEKPTKEAFLHATMYGAREDAGAVVLATEVMAD